MFRLQGYPDNFKIISCDSQSRKQAGNSLPIPMAEAVIKQLVKVVWGESKPMSGKPAPYKLDNPADKSVRSVTL
jgi:hypothetical protein